MSVFPQLRMRRLRRTASLRKLVQETALDTGDLIYPLFVVEGKGIRHEISSMPGIDRFSPDNLPGEIEELARLKIPAVILFGIPEHKDADGSTAYQPDGVVQQAIKVVKRTVPEMLVLTDVCLCEYTSHGHCGVITNGAVDNDRTVPLLARMALTHVQAGADIVAPSDMMDGRVQAIRQILDNNGHNHIPILAYAAKYASGFYGPFREAAESVPQFGDRRSYQMDPPNVREAIREVEQDIGEGADMVMVKPALPYLDVIRRVRDTVNYPLGAYNVSGEYAMVKAASLRGWLEERRVVIEILTAIRRAGADFILTYHAKDFARWQQE